MKRNILAIMLVLGVIVFSASAASALRGKALKQESGGVKHTLEEKKIDQGLADSTQFVEAQLKSNTKDRCGDLYSTRKACISSGLWCEWDSTSKICYNH